MLQKDIELNSSSWNKAQSAAGFIQKACEYKSSIWVEKDSKKANAKSLLGLLALGITPGCSVRLIAQGEDEEAAIALLSDYMANNA
ncbi:MAG: HPr family phosphocarrier protein [Oscillospiraceae bacterium]|nr:HPr family phosphocarrier protein [Oscillospiraceae bacterium]